MPDARVAILRSACEADRASMSRRLLALQAALARPEWGDDDALDDHVAACIHHWYGGA